MPRFDAKEALTFHIRHVLAEAMPGKKHLPGVDYTEHPYYQHLRAEYPHIEQNMRTHYQAFRAAVYARDTDTGKTEYAYYTECRKVAIEAIYQDWPGSAENGDTDE